MHSEQGPRQLQRGIVSASRIPTCLRQYYAPRSADGIGRFSTAFLMCAQAGTMLSSSGPTLTASHSHPSCALRKPQELRAATPMVANTVSAAFVFYRTPTSARVRSTCSACRKPARVGSRTPHAAIATLSWPDTSWCNGNCAPAQPFERPVLGPFVILFSRFADEA